MGLDLNKPLRFRSPFAGDKIRYVGRLEGHPCPLVFAYYDTEKKFERIRQTREDGRLDAVYKLGHDIINEVVLTETFRAVYGDGNVSPACTSPDSFVCHQPTRIGHLHLTYHDGVLHSAEFVKKK